MGAPKLTVKIEGLEDVVNELVRRGQDVSRALESICQAGAEVIRREAASRAPGSLGEDLQTETTKRTVTRVEVRMGPLKKRGYIHRFVEFGTEAHEMPKKKRRKRKVLLIGGNFYSRVTHPGARKQPFMRPAYFAKRAAAEEEVRVKVGGALRV